MLREPIDIREGETVVLWSGWLGPDADAARYRFPAGAPTWTPDAWAAFEDVLGATLAEASRRGTQILLRPHSRHMASDVPSIQKTLSLFEDPRLGLLLDPAMMLSADMLPDAADHLLRILEALGGHPRTAAVLLTGVERAGSDGDPPTPCPLSHGEFDREDLLGVLRAAGPRETPIAILDDEVDAQERLLAEAGLLSSLPKPAT
ncbi:MAG: hypothetical protein AAFX79_02490 [Planctomycetota bacterium]